MLNMAITMKHKTTSSTHSCAISECFRSQSQMRACPKFSSANLINEPGVIFLLNNFQYFE